MFLIQVIQSSEFEIGSDGKEERNGKREGEKLRRNLLHVHVPYD